MFIRSADFSPANIARAIPLPAFMMPQRSAVPLYHQDTVNHCPSCSHTQWHIGRATAECAFCATAMPLSAVAAQPMEPRFTRHAGRTLKAA